MGINPIEIKLFIYSWAGVFRSDDAQNNQNKLSIYIQM